MKMLKRALACTVTKGAETDKVKSFTFVASTDSIDRYGEVVKQDWDLKGFESNPVILWAHDPQEPIGRGRAYMKDGKLKVDVEFHDVTEKARDVAALVDAGFLNTVSVGFRPKTVRFETIEEREVPVLSGNELLEISVVSIPANPDALAERAFLRSLAGEPAAHVTKESSMLAEIRKALGLADTATDDEVLAQARAYPAALDTIGSFLQATGTESSELALGAIKAFRDSHDALPAVQAELAALKDASVASEKSVVIAKLKSEGRVSPAQITWLETQPVDVVKGFAQHAPVVPQLDPAKASVSPPEARTQVKGWEEMTLEEKTSLKKSDPAAFSAAYKTYLARTGR